MSQQVVRQFTEEEWVEFKQVLQRSCKCEDRRKRKLRGMCGHCRLKQDDRLMSYLLYWKRNVHLLLAAEGLDETGSLPCVEDEAVWEIPR